MTLRRDAIELSKVLSQIVADLGNFNADNRSSYTNELARSLAPIVAVYDQAVFEYKSRTAASDALRDMVEYMHEVNGAATKGEINFTSANVLNKYWRLRTIFQESRYRDQVL